VTAEPADRARHSIGSLAGRVALLFGGSFLATLCYAITIRAHLGLGPLFVLPDGVTRQTGIEIGQSVIVVGFAMALVAVGLRSWPGPGTLVLPVFAGVTLDLLLPHVPNVHGLLLRSTAVLAATWIMALGGALIIRASIGVAAYDAVMLGLRRVFGRPLGPTRIAMELSVLAAGWLLGGSVGVGTIVTGLLIGPGLQFWLRLLDAPMRPAARSL
jgi:uncharacterized membrane protein YczE